MAQIQSNRAQICTHMQISHNSFNHSVRVINDGQNVNNLGYAPESTNRSFHSDDAFGHGSRREEEIPSVSGALFASGVTQAQESQGDKTINEIASQKRLSKKKRKFNQNNYIPIYPNPQFPDLLPEMSDILSAASLPAEVSMEHSSEHYFARSKKNFREIN